MKKKYTVIASVAVGLLALAAVAVKVLFVGTYEGSDVRINIPAGASAAQVDSLLEAGLGATGTRVARLWHLKGASPARSHGSYLVTNGQSSLDIARRIINGRQTPVRLTFNNLRTMGDLAAKVAATLEADSAAFVAAADSLLSQQGFAPEQYTAAFLPDTYEFYWTASLAKVAGKLLETRQAFWTPQRRAKAESMGLTPEDVHTLASIVEAETAKTDERPKVARLYLNRLDKDMPLQADPTIKFALGDPTIRRTTGPMLKVESPYNTYLHRGLPPGPIAIVERATLQQVLDAPVHPYLYMCAKSDFSGYHDFSETFDRHRINAARYHRALNARGIK